MRLLMTTLFALGALALVWPAQQVLGQDEARVRVAHASPDAPAVDILVNDGEAFGDVAFQDITEYAALAAGTYNVKVVPAGATEPVVIEADLELMAGTDYTVAATGLLADIAPLVLVDNNGAPEPGNAHVRFVHASPDAPAVDIAVKDGPVLFSNVAFREVGDYTPVPMDRYDLEVRAAGTETVALEIPGVVLRDGNVYTVFAMGLLAGEPMLEPVLSADVNPARVRVAHASPDAPAVDILVNDGEAFGDVAFQDITDYAALPAGTYNVKVVPAGATEPVVIEADLELMAGQDYTVAATGLLADIAPLVLMDNNAPPELGKAHVRFVHASPDAPAVDIAVKDGPVLFANVAFGEVGDYLPVDAGTYDLEVRPAGTETVALEIPGVMLEDGAVYTVFAMGLLAGEPPLTPVPSVDAMYSVPVQEPEGEARVRVAHASPDAPAVDILVNDGEAFGDVAFQDITDYATLAAGTYNVKVVPAGATEPVVIEADLELMADQDYTVAATGLLADIAPLVLMDNNAAPEAGNAHVRFVHASPDAPAVDIAVKGGPVLFSNVAFQEVGDYTPVPMDRYDLEVRPAGSETVALEIPGVVLRDGNVYTVFAMGLLSGEPMLEPVLSADVNPARVRVAHASPDAPAVDILVNDGEAFGDVAFQDITDYAALPAGTYNVKVVPAGATEPVVIEADLEVMAGQDYTVAATGLLAEIAPLVLMDNNAPPDMGMAHVRFVHASPDAPAVDIAVKDGPVLFSNVAFGEVGDYLPVDAGTYDLEVRPAGSETVALEIPGVMFDDGTVYTVFAMGLLDGDPSLAPVPSADAVYSVMQPAMPMIFLPMALNAGM